LFIGLPYGKLVEKVVNRLDFRTIICA
jgi:hypothetical protein